MFFFKDNKGRKLSEEFGTEKVIVGIKDNNISIRYRTHNMWILPFLPMFYYTSWLPILTAEERTTYMIGMGIGILIVLLLYLSSIKKVYFQDNYLIQENILKIKKKININKYPRVYFRKHISKYYGKYRTTVSEGYVLYIEQENKEIRLSSKIKDINRIINNLVMKDKYALSNEEWKTSVNPEEKFFEDCAEKLNENGNLIGVKDNKQNMKIGKGEKVSITALSIGLCVFIALTVWTICESIYGSTYGTQMLVFFNLLVCFIILCLIISDKNKNTLKIKYIDNNKLKIDNRIFDYKNDTIKMFITEIQVPTEPEKYKYTLSIQSSTDTYHINLNRIKREKFKRFLDNLIFSEINNSVSM